jgi:hypothetical protein
MIQHLKQKYKKTGAKDYGNNERSIKDSRV